MDFSKYKFRSHMVGKIVNVPKPLTKRQLELLSDYNEKLTIKPLTVNQTKDWHSLNNKLNESKKFSLTDGIKKTLSELAYAEKYNRRNEINSSKITKGLEVEKNSRDILTRVTGLFLTSSEERKTNDWVTGKIDIEPNDVIVDIKSTWSWSSYSTILQDKPNEIYLRQGDSYMDLWNKKEFLLCHVLTDTPAKLVEGEIRSYDYKHNILNMEGDIRDENIEDVKRIVTNLIFSRKALEDFCDYSTNVHINWFNDFIEIEEKDRVHMILHHFDNDRIMQRNACIELARKHMNTVTSINNFQPELIH